MIMDKLTEFCSETAVNTGGAGTYLLGSQIDTGALFNGATSGKNFGPGEPDVYLVISTGATEIITAGAAGTVQFKLASDSTAAIATDGSATEHLLSPVLVSDDAAANDDRLNAGGQILVACLPYGTYERFLGILQVTGTTALSAGTLNAYLTLNPPYHHAYPDALV